MCCDNDMLVFDTAKEVAPHIRDEMWRRNIKFFKIEEELKNGPDEFEMKIIKFLRRRHVPDNQQCYFEPEYLGG